MAGPRRRARIVALQALFEAEIANHDPEAVLGRLLEEGAYPQGVGSFAGELVRGVIDNRQRIDAAIQRAAPAWPVEQLSYIDRNILRLAIFELLVNNKVPPKAAINEAVELAKAFGSDSSARFINGVLGTVITRVTGRG